MPDITICENKECPKRKSCYRFTAKPGLLQSYFIEKFKQPCEYYIKIK